MEDDSVLVRDPETKKIRTHHTEKRGKSACNHSSFTKTGVEVSDTSILMARAANVYERISAWSKNALLIFFHL